MSVQVETLKDQAEPWFTRTERLTKPERIALLSFGTAFIAFDAISLLVAQDGSPLRAAISISTTLALLLYLWSPLLATVSMGLVVTAAFVLGAPDGAMLGAATAAIFVTRLASAPLLMSFAGGVLVCTVILISDGAVPTGNIATFLALVAIGGAIGLGLRPAVGRNRRLERQLEQQAEREREAIAAERRWFAAELHDSIAHHLAIVSLHSQLLDDDELRPTSLEAIQEATRQALSDLRFIINFSEGSTPGAAVVRGDLARAMDEAKREFEAAGHPTVVAGDPTNQSIPRGVEIILARMVRESATNVVKYAGEGTVRLDLNIEPDAVSLEVRSPLPTGAPRVLSSTGTGISRMSERALNLRGEFSAGPKGEEWSVFTRLPIVPGDSAR